MLKKKKVTLGLDLRSRLQDRLKSENVSRHNLARLLGVPTTAISYAMDGKKIWAGYRDRLKDWAHHGKVPEGPPIRERLGGKPLSPDFIYTIGGELARNGWTKTDLAVHLNRSSSLICRALKRDTFVSMQVTSELKKALKYLQSLNRSEDEKPTQEEILDQVTKELTSPDPRPATVDTLEEVRLSTRVITDQLDHLLNLFDSSGCPKKTREKVVDHLVNALGVFEKHALKKTINKYGELEL